MHSLFCNHINCLTEYKIKPPMEITSEEQEEDIQIISNTLTEFARVTPIVKKSVMLLSGNPGIGKSTLCSQLMLSLNCSKYLYLCGEETVAMVKARFKRLNSNNKLNNIEIVSFFYIEELEYFLNKHKPSFVVLDSIYTMRSHNNSSIRENVVHIYSLVHKHNCAMLLITHVTKDGIISGPKTLEHLVDVVLYLEAYDNTRIIRCYKNRFASTDKIGIFVLHEKGLLELKNPSAHFTLQEPAVGAVNYAGMDDNRSYILEVQALVNKSKIPQLESVGISNKRLKMLLAILSKWCKIHLYSYYIFVNVANAIAIRDPTIDVAVIAAIFSSYYNKQINKNTVFFGEIGLTGKVRFSSRSDKLIEECKRLGFNIIFTNNKNSSLSIRDITVLHKLFIKSK